MTRALLLVEKGQALAWADLRGALADASIGLLVAGAAGLLLASGRRWGRALALGVVLALVWVSFAMYEFIWVFDSLYALSHAGFLSDSTFLGGSARHLRHPLVIGLFVVGSAVAVWRAQAPPVRWWRWWGAAVVVAVLGQMFIPISNERDEWRQRHAVQANLSIGSGSTGIGPASIRADVSDALRGDLRGTRWTAPLADRPNVLLILIEAASGAHLPSVATAQGVESATTMPKLDAIAQDHILFTGMISHQRQTNRGEYGILCGDYPKLLTDQSKMSEQVYGEARRCLPAVLRDEGYATAYIQSAPLGFMMKDQFMLKAGFEELVGDAGFEESYARTDWGVDDKAFFEQSLGRVLDLHGGEQPFFAALLTVGTHHPFTFPEAASAPGARTRQERAFRWADDALAEFLSALEAQGVLRDTVVIITSDESAGLVTAASATQKLLSQSWSFAVVMMPDRMQKRVDTLYAHVDTALSVLDLLGLQEEAERFVGRSWFRDYDRPRPLFAGNTYARRVIMWEPSGGAVVCSESFRSCASAVPVDGRVFGPGQRTESVAPQSRRLLMEVARLTRSGRGDMTEAEPLELWTGDTVPVPASDGKKLLIGGQYLRVPGGTTLRVDFDIEVAGAEAIVDLHQDVFLNGYEQFARKGIQVRGGERWRLSYQIAVPKDSSQLVVQLYATTVAGVEGSIEFHDARLSMTSSTEGSPRVVVIRDEVSPAAPR